MIKVKYNKDFICIGTTKADIDNTIEIDARTSFTEGDPIVDVAKRSKKLVVRSAYQIKVDALARGYAQYELDSFADQRVEYRNWKADDTSPTPVIDAIAAGRGISREDLLAKVEEKVVYIATLQGQQNAKEDEINACTTLEEVEAVKL